VTSRDRIAPADGLTAAVYVRKSQDQNLPDIEKSVTRQVERATAYAMRKGWTVDPAHVYQDDAVSGAEFGVKRSGFLALMNALKPRPPFQVLIVTDQSRLGRSLDEVPYAIKRITDAGVRIRCYLTDTEVKRESAADKFMVHAIAFVDDMHREQSRERTRDALRRKVERGQVAGGKVYRYQNVEIRGDHGQRLHVLRVIEPAEAALVRRIFEGIAAGHGFKRLAKTFDAEGLRGPRGASWSPTMIRELVHRPLYRGQVVWNKTGWVDRDGTKVKVARPPAEWLTRAAPELRIVPEPLWLAAHGRLQATVAVYRARSSTWGRPPDPGAARYLLTGFTECACCGGSMVAWGRAGHGTTAYRCSYHHHRGARVCANMNTAPVQTVTTAVLAGLREQVFAPDLWLPVLRETLARAQARATSTPDRRRELERQLRQVEQELERLATALAQGGPLPSLLAKLQEREAARAALDRQRAVLATSPSTTRRWDPRILQWELRARVADWQGLLEGNLHEARELLRRLLPQRLRFTPRPVGGYEITGPVALG
jgi:DNA invertase Pin-like site-specific DNA recombinase